MTERGLCSVLGEELGREFPSIHLGYGLGGIIIHLQEAWPKTAFSIRQGLWQFKRMPFRLYNTPAIFKCLMERVLADIPQSCCVVKVDDLHVHAADCQHASGQSERYLPCTFTRQVFVLTRRSVSCSGKRHPSWVMSSAQQEGQLTQQGL